MSFEIVKTRRDFLPRIYEIEQLCFSVPWSYNDVMEMCSNPLFSSFCAVEDGIVIGYAGMFEVAGEGQIANVATHPDHRRKGVADALVSRLISYSVENNIFILMLEARSRNTAAISLYKKHGFCECGIRRGYYSNPKDDAVLFNLELSGKENN